LASAQGALHALENSLYRHLRLRLGDAGFSDHFINDIELDQSRPPNSPSKPMIGMDLIVSQAGKRGWWIFRAPSAHIFKPVSCVPLARSLRARPLGRGFFDPATAVSQGIPESPVAAANFSRMKSTTWHIAAGSSMVSGLYPRWWEVCEPD